MVILGLVGGLTAAVLAPWLVGSVLSIPQHMKSETLIALFFLAVSIPIVIVTSGFRGILEGAHRFDLVNIVKAPLGALTYLGPLLVLPFTNELPGIVAVLVAGRLLLLLAYVVMCAHIFGFIRSNAKFSDGQVRQLITFGGWMTLSNIAGPLLLYLSRSRDSYGARC